MFDVSPACVSPGDSEHDGVGACINTVLPVNKLKSWLSLNQIKSNQNRPW